MRFALLLLASVLQAQSTLDFDAIQAHLTPKNPYVQSALLPQSVAQGRSIAADAPFDPTANAQFERKRYPLGDADFYDLTLTQNLPYGLSLFGGHRRSEGVSEYHNIKTGDLGEWRIGAKADLFALAHSTTPEYLAREEAALAWRQSTLDALEELRILGQKITHGHIQACYAKEVHELEQALLERIMQRHHWIKARIDEGQIEAIALEENRALILHQERRVRSAQTRAQTLHRSLATYLGLDLEAFDARYRLETPALPNEPLKPQQLFEHALLHRSDLRSLALRRERLTLQSDYVSAQAYPKTTLSLQGVHDQSYEEGGFKLALNAEFPLPQSRYKGDKLRFEAESSQLDATEKRTLLELRTTFENGVQQLQTLHHNIIDLKQEEALHVRLLRAEQSRFELGQSDLFRLNAREEQWLSALLRTLEAEAEYRIGREALLYQSVQESLLLIMKRLIKN
ncbi:MAG: TolC family protein [Campylobacterales bacterium]|nr:TolC family protein [Campylobacterales bacterium]